MSGYNPEQKEFLEKFYDGVTDPETRFQMLCTATGQSNMTFHAVKADSRGGTLKGLGHNEMPFSTQIAILEFDLLVDNNLLAPEFR